jgi:hypothetical protein
VGCDTATNPLTNLARCFRCRRNFNPIEMVMAVQECSFVEAVERLKNLLPKYASPRPDGTPSEVLDEPGAILLVDQLVVMPDTVLAE